MQTMQHWHLLSSLHRALSFFAVHSPLKLFVRMVPRITEPHPISAASGGQPQTGADQAYQVQLPRQSSKSGRSTVSVMILSLGEAVSSCFFKKIVINVYAWQPNRSQSLDDVLTSFQQQLAARDEVLGHLQLKLAASDCLRQDMSVQIQVSSCAPKHSIGLFYARRCCSTHISTYLLAVERRNSMNHMAVIVHQCITFPYANRTCVHTT